MFEGLVEVAQFVGYISEQTAYHHGEASLETTIVGMAQDYVGSNNVNLLVPSGTFRTRAPPRSSPPQAAHPPKVHDEFLSKVGRSCNFGSSQASGEEDRAQERWGRDQVF